MSKKIVIANWKMNPRTEQEALKLFGSVAKAVSKTRKTQVIICPPAIYIPRLKKLSKKISLGAQNAFLGDTGPFTGEISPEMLYEAGARYVILGHSERKNPPLGRGETSAEINKKLKSAQSASLTPVLCVGENARDENHEYFGIVREQIKDCLNGINKNLISKIIFVYEPVWAISSTPGRRDATPDDSAEMAIFIRKVLSDLSTPQIANKTKIIYGGSVTERDAEGFLRDGGVDGVMPGRASLTAKKFIEIVNIAEKI